MDSELPACLPADAASMVAVNRAANEMRRGHFVVIEDGPQAAIAHAAETLTEASLAAFNQLSGSAPSLTLTAQRARYLNLPASGPVVTVPLSDEFGVAAVRRLIDPTASLDGVMPTPLPQRGGADNGYATAAVRLSKLAQLLPAALTTPLSQERVAALDGTADGRELLRVDVVAIADYPRLAADTLRPVSDARLPLEAAENGRMVAFRPADGGPEQFAILIGDPVANQPPLCRLHSECFTGDLLGSLRCDCGPQLDNALRLMGEAGHGILLYLAHEGRGIGLINKLRAYQLQDTGLDTVDANQHIGFDADERCFRGAAVMLRHFGITKVRLLTNNPAKVTALVDEGVQVPERVPHIMPANRHNQLYLATKARRSGHLIDS